ncbi:MAG: M12 family metallo-peptidase [Woeseiaceae bacterium]
MKALRLALLAQFLLFIFALTANAATDIVIDHSEPLRQLRYERATSDDVNRKPGDAPVVSISFDAFGRRFELALEENRALTSVISNPAILESIGVYRGRIADQENSWVRLTIENDSPKGMLWDGQEMYAIDLVDNQTAIYRLADLRISGDALSCSVAATSGNGNDLLKAVLAETSANTVSQKGPGATQEIDIAVLGDFEFSSDMAANAEAEILTRMNNVDGIFSTQVGVQLNVNRIDVFSTSNDPFTDETKASDLLDELSAYRLARSAQRGNGLSHLFTGRDLDGSTVGIAYGGKYGAAICHDRYGAGLTQATHGATFDSLIAAHEFGHNFGAPHDGTTDSACEAETQDFLMAPNLNGNDIFSACSIQQIEIGIDRTYCVAPLPTADVTVVAAELTPTALLGNPSAIVFNVNSTGTDDVNNVQLTVSVPPNVVLDSVSAGSGSCTSGAGDVTCSLGTIVAGSGNTVTLNISTPSTGNADFVASITADGDANAGNNQASTLLTIQPAVELVLSAAASVQIDPNQSTSISPRIENRASLAATTVTLTLTPSAGITVDSATWSPGTCVIADNIVTCQAASLAAQANDELLVEVTGVSVGVQSYALAISSSETDRDMSNNNVSGQISVGQAAPAVVSAQESSSGGGGAMSPVFLLLLGIGSLLLTGRRERC